MKSNDKKVFLISYALALVALAQMPISAITSASPSERRANLKRKEKVELGKSKETNTTKKDEISSAEQDKLSNLAQTFQERPDDNSYEALWQSLVSFIQQQAALHRDPSHLFKSWKVLLESGLKVIDPIGADNSVTVYVFNRTTNSSSFVPQTKQMLVQWNEQVSAGFSPERKRSKATKTLRVSTVVKTQLISCPNSVDVKEANLEPHLVSVKIATKPSSKSAKGSKINKASSGSNHYLALLGTDRQSGYTWLSAMKQTSAGWVLYPDLFEDVPSFLLQVNSAKIRFSGNNLIITMTGVGGYELVMPFTEGHFAFSTKEAQDSAMAVARQFLLALQYKKMDMAKVWLSDPKLASIPDYLGLFNHSHDSSPLTIANMQPPICGGSRFRLITNTKDDLIIDVAKIKNQWLIKSLFIAPSTIKASTTVKNPDNAAR